MGLASISNAIRQDTSSGEPLPEVWKSLTEATVVFRRGQTVLLGAAPQVGKSAFALRWVIESGVRAIYFSADSGPGTQLKRCVSIVSGRPMDEVTAAMDRKVNFDDLLKPLNRIWWEFDAGPSFDSIEASVHAYSYLGAYPEAIIIDNLLDVDLGESASSEYLNVEAVMLFAKEMARKTGACVMVLAHLTGEFEDGRTPTHLGSVRGKGGKVPEMVLLPYLDEDDMVMVIAKNRDGIGDGGGNHTVTLRRDMSRMLIEDY